MQFRLLKYITGWRYIAVTVVLVILFFEIWGRIGLLYLLLLKIVFATILAIIFRKDLLEIIKMIERNIWGKTMDEMEKGEKWKYNYRLKLGGKVLYDGSKRSSRKRS